MPKKTAKLAGGRTNPWGSPAREAHDKRERGSSPVSLGIVGTGNGGGLAALCAAHGIESEGCGEQDVAESSREDFVHSLGELSKLLEQEDEVRVPSTHGQPLAFFLARQLNDVKTNNTQALLGEDERRFASGFASAVSPESVATSTAEARTVATFLSKFDVEQVCEAVLPEQKATLSSSSSSSSSSSLQLDRCRHEDFVLLFQLLSQHIAASATGIENVAWALDETAFAEE